MSHITSDYENNRGSNVNSYSSLGSYNVGYSMGVPAQGKVTSGRYIVPTWSNLSYNALTPAVPSGSGYYNINNAYGENSANCQTAYRSSLCSPQ